MSMENISIYLNATICLLICWRLMFFQKTGRYRFRISLLAYCLILASGWTAFRLLWGRYINVDPAEIALNLFVCFALLKARGNLASLTQNKKSRTCTWKKY